MWSSPTSRRAKAACAISIRCSGSPNTSTACATPSELVGAGLFTAKEFALFRRCEEFLWAVRCHLHFLTGRPEERLSFDFQRPIAQKLGYTPRAGLTDAERFMKHYFLIAKDVGDLTAIVCAALEERQAKPRPVLDRFIGRLRRRSSVIADAKDFKIEFDRISVVRSDAFERDPVNLIRLFWVADRGNLAIHPDATRLVTHSLKRIDAELRSDPEANRLFLEILTSRHSPETVLRHMNEAGVLGPLHPRFRPHRRDDAIHHVSPLYGRRASAAHDRRARQHRGGQAGRGPSAGQ